VNPLPHVSFTPSPGKKPPDQLLTKLDKGVGAKAWAIHFVSITDKELLGEIVQVCESELARVVAFAYAEVDDTVIDNVAIERIERQTEERLC